MAGEGPPFLTVGTDVSAKYRGAFCEAKVKVVKKLVKCKINFKNGTSCMVSDELVKGTSLKIGTKVEAKMTESSPYEEGTIMKVIDGSLYTVVFDDGDEKTLRRTLLCLQGEKHFHESETLDHLPLTDPENFGTPVVKDSKMRRKRRMSNRSQRSEDEEEEEDDEEDSDSDTPKKQHKEEPEDAVGKIVIVEMNEKRKNFFFPALVVDSSCTKDVQVKGKDYIVTRSFKDNKFYTVSKQSRKAFLSKDHTYKGDVASLKAAHEKAVTFIDTGQLPSNWDMDMLKKKNTGKQQADTNDDTSEDSSDDEYDMEKDAWLASLHKFMEERGTPINKPPLLGLQDLNLYKLYKLVQDHGGCRKVTDKQMWRHIMTKMNITPVPAPQQPYNIHTSYNKYLFAFEEFNRKMGPGPRVFTRTRRRSFDRGWISPPSIFSRQRSSTSRQQGFKDEPSDKEEDEQESPSKKRVTRKKGEDNKSQEQEESKRETREAKSRTKDIDKQDKDTSDQDDKKSAKKQSKDDKVKERASKDDKSKDKSSKAKDTVKDVVKDKSGKADKVKDKVTKEDKVKDKSKDTPSKDEDEKTSEKASDGKEKLKDLKGKDKGKIEKVKEEKEDRTKEEKTKDVKSEAKGPGPKGKEKRKSKGDSGREDNSSSPVPTGQITDAGYNVGEKVHVHYGRGRTEKIYEAKVVDIELKGKDHVFTVHYTGWNNRYDEAIKKNRIVGSAEKKKKPPTKLTPKGKGDVKEKTKKESEKREEQQKKEKEETERKELEEIERKAKQEREQKAREETERLEKARALKERQEKEKQERLERERKEKQERERLERERKEKQEREKRERLEREQQEKELKERLEKERQERERKEKLEKERKEKQEKDRQERLEQEKREKEEAEKLERELAEKAAKEAAKEKKEKAGKEAKKTPTGKRGRPSLNKTSSPAPQTPPRTTPSGRGKSPSPASVFSQRSMRSDRKSLTESPFAMGLNARARSKRSSTGEYRRGGPDDSDSELDELLDGLSESQQSNQDSEDSQMKDGRGQEEPDDHDDNESTKTEDYAATLTKVSEEKPSFDEFLDEGPPTLTAEVVPETLEERLQEVESEVPIVEVEDKVTVEKEGRGRPKKESKIRLRKSIDKEREGKDSGSESIKGDKVAGKDTAKGSSELDESKEKIDDTPVLERQVPMEADVQEKMEELKQEVKGSASDTDKPIEKKKGRRKGRKSLESRKRSKASLDVAEVSEKSEASEPSEPKKKHAKMEKKKSEKVGRKYKVHETKAPADNTDSDFGTSSIDDKSIPGTSKSFMTTPPTTPEGSPKMPLSPAPEEIIQMKTEEQSSNKSDSDALIEVANIDEKELSQTAETNVALSGSAQPKSRTPATTTSQQVSPKKRRRGTSESEHTKKRRKHNRRRQSSISERRQSAKERGNNNSSDTDESRSESRLTSSSAKRHMSLKKYAGSLPPSKVASSSDRNGSEKQRRWNFLVDLSNVKEPDERIAIIQHQLSELRSVYLQLKQEVATIDRRRKKFRKKEREAAQVMAGVALGHCLSQGQDRVDPSGS